MTFLYEVSGLQNVLSPKQDYKLLTPKKKETLTWFGGYPYGF